MSQQPFNPSELRMLPGGGEATTGPAVAPRARLSRQLSDLPRDELENLAEEFGLEPRRYKTRQHLVAAIHDRRQMIAAMDREAMLDVIKWGRRPIPVNASKEHIALEIARIETMRFVGLSHRGLLVLAKLRGIEVRDDELVPMLIRKLKRQEGLFRKINRKRRALLGSIISSLIGDTDAAADYRFLPPQTDSGHASADALPGSPPSQSIKREIEESGLIGGIAGRIRKSADTYVNHKLDEIEARIDRKLDEIDRRLAEWRDKEVANRIRILKITLWASVIVGAFSLIYSYLKVYFLS